MLNVLKVRYRNSLKKIKELEAKIKNLEQESDKRENDGSGANLSLKEELVTEIKKLLGEEREKQKVKLTETLLQEENQLQANVNNLTLENVLEAINDGISKIEEKLKQAREERREMNQRNEEFFEIFSDNEGGTLGDIMSLTRELLELKEEVKQKKETIAHEQIKNKIREKEQEISASRQNIEKEITKKQGQLNREKDICIDMIDKMPFLERLSNFIKGNKRLKSDKLDEILSFQEVISKGNDSDDGLLNYKLRELLGISKNKEITKKVKDLRQLKKEITKLELELKNIDRAIKIFNVSIYSSSERNATEHYQIIN